MKSKLSRLYNALTRQDSVWREVYKYGIRQRSERPQAWLRFRHGLTKLCALMRQPPGALRSDSLVKIMPPAANTCCSIQTTESSVYNVSTDELLILSTVTAVKKPNAIFEFGTFDGRTTLHFAINSAQTAKIYTVDIAAEQIDLGPNAEFMDATLVGERVKKTPYSSKVTFITADSAQYDFTKFSNSIDLIFVDGDHSFDGVMRDSLNAYKMLKNDGIVIWHDYLLLSDVTRALNNLKSQFSLIRIENTTLVLGTKLVK